MPNLSHMKKREQLIEVGHLLDQAGVMSHSGHGNMSVRVGNDRMLLTAHGIITDLQPEQFAVVTFDGKVVDGSLDPVTHEIVAMHSCVYQRRPEIGSVIHTHSPHVTSFALANKPLPCVYEALLRFGITEDIPVADWAPRGSPESVGNIVRQLELHPTVNAVLLGNHGLLAFAGDATATALLIVSMEEAAEMTLEADMLGGAKPFPPGALDKVRQHMRQFHS
ncbi:MAG TPA: class II aldolase/adducin family protein [Ktedonobacteraceae bacterium]|nr:class II aldolase/adducin family protein [Ktedonobacteraceae bacterium]